MDVFNVTVKSLKRTENTESWVTTDRMLLVVMNNVFHRYNRVDSVFVLCVTMSCPRLANASLSVPRSLLLRRPTKATRAQTAAASSSIKFST